MPAVHSFRSFRSLASFALGAALICAGLGGCRSEQDERIAAARESVLQQKTEDQTGRPEAPVVSAAPALRTSDAAHAAAGTGKAGDISTPLYPGVTTDGSRPAAAPAKASDIGMPLYPGARKMSTGPGDNSWVGEGLSMALLETRDSVDSVIDFYTQKLNETRGPLPPTKTEDRLDGHRVVRLSASREGGGLQTVEAREDNGKTTIQLMNMKAGPHAAVPATIPGVVPSASSAGGPPHRDPALPAGSTPHDLTVPSGHAPRDLTIPTSATPRNLTGPSSTPPRDLTIPSGHAPR